MARRRNSSRRRRRGGYSVLYKLLSLLLICACVIVALTLFFRIEHIEVTGQQRYTEEEVAEASGVELGDNLYLLNKPTVVSNILERLPYIERVKRVNRQLPDTLTIEVEESGAPVALVQDGGVWLISSAGKIVERLEGEDTGDYAVISGLYLLAPSVGTSFVVAAEDSGLEESLLALLEALEAAEMLGDVRGIRMEDPDYLAMDYTDRFTVRLPYGADYPYKLRFLQAVLADEKIQDNMTGTFDMCSDDGRTNFIQNVH